MKKNLRPNSDAVHLTDAPPHGAREVVGGGNVGLGQSRH